MLQIISGKFFGTGEIIHNECNGILYSNASFHAIQPIDYGNIKINTVDWNPGYPCYVFSYDNCIERTPKTSILVKIGDNVVIEQLKYILSFSMDAIFDESELKVEELCRQGSISENNISSYVDKTFEKQRNLNEEDWEKSIEFYKKMLNLSRDEYKVVMKCLVAYHASFSVFSRDISLAYSILVYALETLCANFDEYTTSWNDYDQNIKKKLDVQLDKVDNDIAEEIRNILVSKEHMKLSRRFCQFILKYINDDYYKAIDKRQGTESEINQAIAKAYIIRSKYAHELKPIMKQLMDAGISKSSEIFEFQHETFFTYSGLLRLARTIITNFVISRDEIESEEYAWDDDLPGTISMELHPNLWLGKSNDFKFQNIDKNLEALLYCIETEHKVPQMDELVENYMTNIHSIKESERCAAYVLSWIYVNVVQGLDNNYVNKIRILLDKHSEMANKCCIATIIGNSFGMPTRGFDLEEVVSVINNYDKNKFKKNKLKIHNRIENSIYMAIASSYKAEDNNSCKYWYEKAYKNAVNDKELQGEILKEIELITI